MYKYSQRNWRPSVCEMDDLPGHLVAITSTYTTKLERFDEIGTSGKRNFEKNLPRFSVFRRINSLSTK